MQLDLYHRPTLVKSWLATLHAAELRVQPSPVGPLPGWGPLLRTAAAWHVAYALFAYAGALVAARSGQSAVAGLVRGAGTPGVLLTALVVWWAGVALSTAIWWMGIKRVRSG